MNDAQCRMARAGLRLSLNDLGALAGVRPMTISKFEGGGSVIPATVEKLRQCLVGQGVEFINGGKAIGVKVQRAASLHDRAEQLREVQAAHHKVTKLISERKGGR